MRSPCPNLLSLRLGRAASERQGTARLVNISVVIPNFNGAHLLDDCLGSLRRQSLEEFEVVLVDDASTDDSIGVAKRLFPGIRIVELSKNAGFAAASNAGIRESSGDLLFLLNNDTELAPTCLSELAKVCGEEPLSGMVAPKILNFYDRTIIDSVGGLLVTLDAIGNGRGRGEIDTGQYDAEREVFFPSACAAVYRREMLNEIGLFPEDFRAYCEDTDLGLRARWAGWSAVAAPGAIIFHKYSDTVGAYSASKLFLVERNRIAALLRNYPITLLPITVPVSIYRYGLMAFSALTGRGRGEAVARVGAPALLLALVRAWREALLSARRQLATRPRLKRVSTFNFVRLLLRHRLAIRRLVLTR